MKELLAIDGTRRVRCDQCQFGLTSVDDAGNVEPARKATRFMTNDEYIAEAWTDAVSVGMITFSCRTAEQRLAKSILHGWWR